MSGRSVPLPTQHVTAATLRAKAIEVLSWDYEFYHDEMSALLTSAAIALERKDSDAPYAFWIGKEAA